ncbi:DUF1642 domain-containing protein [Lactococcus lactis]|uniref:DUF1642 domain-containing protein n=2 Tax=Lactococcus lactis TaxID=1358 RepID=UPI002891B0C9|nr:DUF1642 domain-containing protein [Lactococcus lactis]MDT2867143.1 DUF1642 domain-containing protein [Lactococcus lactis]MDT2896131.1 DUF1642 domain-containing protein [Lactococcus lactis]MDT2896262.1 DUF1642 domain-containing protein [Lactococcus lactis]MDT2948656.1 DUF1642 domain-containing protein [Lactococcus lactis]
MTKFEEEFKALTSWDWINVDTIQQILKRFGNWHSDEEFKELLDKYNNLNNLKLQQQALPVVPEDVDKAIKYLKTQNNFATFADFDDILTEKGLRWLNDFQFKDRRFGFGGLNNKLFILSHLAVTGYRVEKTQLFKIIFPNSTTVLQKDGELNSFADTVYKKYLIENAMTEQEIKSIDKRYWEFAVPVEDGE